MTPKNAEVAEGMDALTAAVHKTAVALAKRLPDEKALLIRTARDAAIDAILAVRATLPPASTANARRDSLASADQATTQAPCETLTKLIDLARIVDRAVDDWGESFADGSCEVKFHKEEAEKLMAILDAFDELPENPNPLILDGGPLKAARHLAAPVQSTAAGERAQRDQTTVNAAGARG